MITLITGTPGAGKTALAVSMLMEEAGARPIFVSGIPELKIDHQQTPPVEEWTVETPTPEDPNYTRPTFTFPPNSIIVIDEAQNVYRPRAATSKVPPYVAAFETHRHTGVDFWLITQHPGLIDGNVRKLVGRHVHIRNTPLGRYLFEWPEAQDPESSSARQIAARRKYKLPKRAFDQYKSASLHVKHRFRIPGAVYLLGASVAFLGFAGYYMYGRYRDVVAPSPYAAPGQTPALAAPGQTPSPVVPGQHPGQQQGKPILTPDEYVQLHKPRLAGLAHTAAVYDGVTAPKRVPVPAACLATSTRCRCFTQDATPYQIDDDMCRQLVAGGLFLPFDPEGQREGQGRPQQHTTHASTASMGGGDVGRTGPVVVPIPDYGDFVGVSSRQRQTADRTYTESVPAEQQAFAPRTPLGRLSQIP